MPSFRPNFDVIVNNVGGIVEGRHNHDGDDLRLSVRDPDRGARRTLLPRRHAANESMRRSISELSAVWGLWCPRLARHLASAACAKHDRHPLR